MTEAPDLSVDLAPRRPGGLVLPNPVLAAAGTFGWGVDYASLVPPGTFGAIVTNGTTLQPRPAPPSPRVAEVVGGMVHAHGWANPGLEAVLDQYGHRWGEDGSRVIVNIVPGDAAEGRALARGLLGMTAVRALEIDVTRALEESVHPDHVARVVHTVLEQWDRPVIVKLPPFGVDVVSLAQRMEEVGADALSVINAVPAVAIDARKQRSVLPGKAGRLSGPAVKPVALYFVWLIQQRVEIPVIGVGGVATSTDAVEFLLAGAAAVQVGSASFRNPGAGAAVVSGLETYLRATGTPQVAMLRGRAA